MTSETYIYVVSRASIPIRMILSSILLPVHCVSAKLGTEHSLSFPRSGSIKASPTALAFLFYESVFSSGFSPIKMRSITRKQFYQNFVGLIR